MTIVLHSCPAVWASGIGHIKYALWVTFNISRLTGLSYQQSNYPPTFSKERNGRLCLYLFSFLLIFNHQAMRTFIVCLPQGGTDTFEICFNLFTPPYRDVPFECVTPWMRCDTDAPFICHIQNIKLIYV